MLVAVAYSLLIHYLLYGTTTIATTCNYYIKIYIYMYHYISIRILYVYTSEHLAIPCATARHVCAWGMAACWTLIQERFPAEPKSGGPKGAKNIIQQAPPLEGTLLYNNRGGGYFQRMGWVLQYAYLFGDLILCWFCTVLWLLIFCTHSQVGHALQILSIWTWHELW